MFQSNDISITRCEFLLHFYSSVGVAAASAAADSHTLPRALDCFVQLTEYVLLPTKSKHKKARTSKEHSFCNSIYFFAKEYLINSAMLGKSINTLLKSELERMRDSKKKADNL